ncbi:hypothetical protein HH308_03255 [Gordonia sp. TBRC 11910]|uniref:Uncharacterized protein n=1 Tax=Gordonia asplenii TaxID=2725283 RepID=A0A848KQB9_9ACTN|nr:hypothetical protein [Gordonia asplenii]NMO00229.1 hypothetical protein [Gordonia asplenii]
MNPKPVVYVDIDNVLVDFPTGIARLSAQDVERYRGHYDDAPGIFALMAPRPGAIDGFITLARHFDTYILSTAPWDNPTAWSDKLSWVHRHLGSTPDSPAYKRLILSHHKDLNVGDFLIDDRLHNGAENFAGEHIHFGQSRFPDWPTVVDYLLATLTV